MTRDSTVVRVDCVDRILVVAIDNPPVNALNGQVRQELLAAFSQARRDVSVLAILLVGAGRLFSAGADIREFGNAAISPSLSELCDFIESCPKIVIAAMHGSALGGGLELCLAAHYRWVRTGTQVGLPEVQLGLMPGAGGTQRLPRLTGMRAAAELILSGRPINADQAVAWGLADALGGACDPVAEGIGLTQRLLATGEPGRRSGEGRALSDQAAARATLNTVIAENSVRLAGQFAPLKIIEALHLALELPMDEGLRCEGELFRQCLESPQHLALKHVFFAEREVAKNPECPDSPRRIACLGVIGGGTMGAGITVAALDAGLSVTLIEQDLKSLERGQFRVDQIYAGRVAKGTLTTEAKREVLARFAGSLSWEALSRVDLVIEAVTEDMAVKKAVFARLDKICQPSTIFTTNTSYLDVNELAGSVSRPSQVIGLHFFSPAHIMKLLEIVVPAAASGDVVATAFALAKRLGKVAVRAGVCDGFIGNRIMAVCRTAMDHVLEEGASPYDIDRAIRAFGFAMGPYQVADLAGGDIGWATRQRKAATRDPQARYVQVSDRLYERGWLGQKTGRGFYRYPNNAKSGVPDLEVLAIVDAERKRAGIVPKTFLPEEITRRYLAALINEAANVIHQGIARRALDVDITLIHGYGFPRYRGGPMYYADTIGLSNIRADIEEFSLEDAQFWQLSPCLKALTDADARFESLNSAVRSQSQSGTF